MFKIEKDIPVPKGSARGRKPIYPFDEMAVGDSIFVEGQPVNGSAYASAAQHARRYGKKFRGKKVEGGVRIWRIE